MSKHLFYWLLFLVIICYQWSSLIHNRRFRKMFTHLHLQLLRYQTLRAYRNGDWRTRPIQDNGEKLVKVPKEISLPYYHQEMNLIPDPTLYLREGVLDRVLKAHNDLIWLGLEIMVYDGWRSVELQENLFWFYMKAFTAERFHLKDAFHNLEGPAIKQFFESLPSDKQTVMIDTNRTYVSWPSKDPQKPSPHATGGAVDVWLHKDGKPVNLGVPFDWMEESAGTFYHLKWRRKRFSGDKTVCKNREYLILAMTNAGFSCYGPEFWHFNFGNQMDALVKKNTACYSYIEP